MKKYIVGIVVLVLTITIFSSGSGAPTEFLFGFDNQNHVSLLDFNRHEQWFDDASGFNFMQDARVGLVTKTRVTHFTTPGVVYQSLQADTSKFLLPHLNYSSSGLICVTVLLKKHII